MNSPTTDQVPFDAHRRLLFRVAYDLLGSVADAEDVVQETWLRWSAADRGDVENPRAYLVQIATRQALNRIRSNRSRRETYIGPWLPEPLVASVATPDPADEVVDRAERSETISMAMLVVLETLSPAERAVFVLREVFGMSHDEVAQALERSPASVRQLAHRAREHVQARRPRFTADDAEQRRVTEEFLLACVTGDLAALTELLTPDVTLTSDGGGKVKAALRPIVGADKAARFMIAIAHEAAQLSVRFALVNGTLGVVGYQDDTPITVALLDLVEGRIAQILIVSNPDKLASIAVIDPPEGPT
ncbi:MAG: RNA polymerase sigma-70 factor [Pseudonocardiales bacterium]